MASSSASEVLRSFCESRHREKMLRLSAKLAYTGGASSSADADPVLDKKQIELAVALVKKVEEGDAETATALVNVLKAFYMGGLAVEVGKVGLEILCEDTESSVEFAELLGYGSIEELREEAAKFALLSASKRAAGASKKPKATTENSKPEGKSKRARTEGKPESKSKRSKGDAESKVIWRVEGDDVLGDYFAIDGSVARVDAWTMRDDRKVFRSTLLLGERRGHLTEVTDERLAEMGHSPHLDEHLVKIDDFENLEGAGLAPVADAVWRLALTAQLDPSWAEQFGELVLAQEKSHEPPWPVVVVDPRSLEDAKLRERAKKCIGTKHLVRFLGMPENASLGFLQPSKFSPYRGRFEPDDRINKLSKKSRRAYDDALLEAKSLFAASHPPPPEGARIQVSYLGEDKTYDCIVVKQPETGLLFVRSSDFGPEEPETIPFDPDEDEWRYVETSPPKSSEESAVPSQVAAS